ncbi:16S rRNA (adenine(1518)-N(6)/adenine(1519)-N(6))-dimethyltransferase RsmA [Accumulibacter sp.]|uniref:16S rRNA (adenine(1518)-N(6)/adenine(1519)-N(6))- dimethyltransferase RsmA n=1 Tax=Accumulibacter sp. TaxID=2053492 RepID=UPI001AD0FB7C|nr:16S rRNA (adenine(1518)-N(6)/adenine(1519)-N(6))-dimethyltransferase RsmA [Accumulibacter sp.]MBN8513110.1 16S rRNA (adenine(1518)-N(6)/adenine(1519)-N(6))-dimethyltransferase RsmA [Accumulibacter sp.]
MRKHVARKRFGQNFLVDEQVIDEIIDQLAVRRGEKVVEIGPGLAALTAPLLRRLDHLHVVEIDRDIVARLGKIYSADKLTVHEGDALAFDFGRLASSAGAHLRIVGNLPYNISTPLLFHLADYSTCVRDMHFMLQSEVVDRMVAEPGSGDVGRLTVMLQYRFVIDRLLDVPPEAFDPPPKVHSALVRLIPRSPETLLAGDEVRFSALVASAFRQRRKMLRNSLRGMVDEDQLAALGVSPTCRAEELSVADYVRLANSLT